MFIAKVLYKLDFPQFFLSTEKSPMEFQTTNVLFSTLASQIEDHVNPMAIFMKNSRFYKISNKRNIKNTALEGVVVAQSLSCV